MRYQSSTCQMEPLISQLLPYAGCLDCIQLTISDVGGNYFCGSVPANCRCGLLAEGLVSSGVFILAHFLCGIPVFIGDMSYLRGVNNSSKPAVSWCMCQIRCTMRDLPITVTCDTSCSGSSQHMLTRRYSSAR